MHLAHYSRTDRAEIVYNRLWSKITEIPAATTRLVNGHTGQEHHPAELRHAASRHCPSPSPYFPVSMYLFPG